MNDDGRIRREIEKDILAFEEDAYPGRDPHAAVRVEASLQERLAGGRQRDILPRLAYALLALVFVLNMLTALLSGPSVKPDLREQLVSDLKTDLGMDDGDGN
jgi:hypothetical protein